MQIESLCRAQLCGALYDRARFRPSAIRARRLEPARYLAAGFSFSVGH
jgi:hypothetical protein